MVSMPAGILSVRMTFRCGDGAAAVALDVVLLPLRQALDVNLPHQMTDRKIQQTTLALSGKKTTGYPACLCVT